MEIRVQRWGNSLAVRIPSTFARQAKVRQNSLVDIKFDDGNLVMSPVVLGGEILASLLEHVTPENTHYEWETGPAAGAETW